MTTGEADPSHTLPVPGDLALPPRRGAAGGACTLIGALGAPARAAVDRWGLVVPDASDGRVGVSPALDWWVGTGERWVVPAREPAGAVRQELLDAAPVVVTTVRVPGGEVVHRAWMVHGNRPLVVVEIENRSKVPVALALAVRPYDLAGPVPVGEVAMDGAAVWVDGRPFLCLPRAPAACALGDAGADSAAVVFANAAPAWRGPAPLSMTCPAGGAQAAVVFPLPHTTVLRVALPAGPSPAGARPLPPPLVAGLAGADLVARGWTAHAERGMRVALPDERWQAAVDAGLRHTVLAADAGAGLLVATSESSSNRGARSGGDAVPGAGPASEQAAPAGVAVSPSVEAALVLAALDRWGLHTETAAVAAGLPAAQARSGELRVPWTGAGSPEMTTAALLWLVGEHYRLRGEPAPEPLLTPVARAAHWLGRRRPGAGGLPQRALRAVLRSPRGADRSSGGDPSRIEREVWIAGAQLAAADLLAVARQPDAAKLVRDLAGDVVDLLHRPAVPAPGAVAGGARPEARTDLAGELALLRLPQPGPAAPGAGQARSAMADPAPSAGPEGGPRLEVGEPPAGEPGAGVEAARSVGPEEGAPPAGGAEPKGVVRPAVAAMAVLGAAHGRRAQVVADIDALLGLAGPTWTWPAEVHPGGGASGAGQDRRAGATFLLAIRELLIQAPPGAGVIVLVPVWPPSWLGQGLEVHGAPTGYGRLSFAVRWHGARPALLWELEPLDPMPSPVRLTIPGLDAGWSTTEPRGEALLEAVLPPGGLPGVYGSPEREARPGADQARPADPGGESFI